MIKDVSHKFCEKRAYLVANQLIHRLELNKIH